MDDSKRLRRAVTFLVPATMLVACVLTLAIYYLLNLLFDFSHIRGLRCGFPCWRWACAC